VFEVHLVIYSPLLHSPALTVFSLLQNFKVQLGPLAEAIESKGLATFTYSQGIHEVDPPAGWEDYFGQRPLYRFLDTTKGDTFETLRRLRHVPRGLNPEDTMRLYQTANTVADWHQRAWREALDSVFTTIDADPEIDAIIGYSEGAMVGASLVVEEGMRCQRSGLPRRIKVRHAARDYHGDSLSIPTHVF
jgi:hypothetical protein